MYIVPQPYKCPECHRDFEWSVHHDSMGLGEPFCSACYMNFIKKNVPMGERKNG
jgi:protein-arginine kinase activator protein McsA